METHNRNILVKPVKKTYSKAIIIPEIHTTVATSESTEYLYKFMIFLGMRMPKRYKFFYIIYASIIMFLVTIWFPISFTISYIQTTNVNIGLLLTSLQVSFNAYSGTFKQLIIIFMLKKLRACESIMKILDARCHDDDEISELRALKIMGRRVVIFFYIAYASYATTTFIGAITNGQPLYSLYIPYNNWRRSKPEFIRACLFEYFLINLACFQQCVNDTYGVIHLYILRTHMKILLLRYQKLGAKSLKPEENYEELKLCIKDHKNLLELFNRIAPIISLTIFIQFMITALCLGLTLINISIFTKEFTGRLGCFVYGVAVVIQVFPLCYFAQCIINDSERLGEVILHSDWVSQDARFRKMLVFFIQRTQRPMEMMAAKLVPVTLNSFVSIAKFSFTLYTFIQKMGIKERFGN